MSTDEAEPARQKDQGGQADVLMPNVRLFFFLLPLLFLYSCSYQFSLKYEHLYETFYSEPPFYQELNWSVWNLYSV